MGRTGERHDAAEKRESFLRILFFGKIHFKSQTFLRLGKHRLELTPIFRQEPGGRFVSLIDRVQFFVQVDFINLSVFLHHKSVFVAANEQRPDNQTFHAFLFGHAQMPGQA